MRPVQKILLLIGIPALVLIFIITAIVMATRGKAEHGSPGTSGEMVAAVTTLHRSPVAMTEEAPGTIVAIQHADIAPKIMSRIAAVYVHEGDQVKAGQGSLKGGGDSGFVSFGRANRRLAFPGVYCSLVSAPLRQSVTRGIWQRVLCTIHSCTVRMKAWY